MTIKKILSSTAIALHFFAGCTSKNTKEANQAYKFWAGENPPNEIKVLNGSYQQSAHFTKEYTMYLHLKAPANWIKAFNEQSQLGNFNSSGTIPETAPSWFKPFDKFILLTRKNDPAASLYYENPETGEMYIYEIQL